MAVPKVTTAGKAKASCQVKFVVRRPGELVVDVDYDAARGKVSGMKAYLPGKTVTLKATALKGFQFSGWYAGEKLVSDKAKHRFAMGEADVRLRAEFVPKAAD